MADRLSEGSVGIMRGNYARALKSPASPPTRRVAEGEDSDLLVARSDRQRQTERVDQAGGGQQHQPPSITQALAHEFQVNVLNRLEVLGIDT
jgi:hypothetical protein